MKRTLSILIAFLINSLSCFCQEFRQNQINSSATDQPVQFGTGFAIEKSGYVITNYHVVNVRSYENTQGRIGDRFQIIQQINGEVVYYEAKIVSEDAQSDLVILKIIDKNFLGFPNLPYTIKFQTSEKGTDVFTIGYPRFDLEGLESKVTKGNIVANTGLQGDVGHYTISCPIDHGSSGGPLFDSDGNVIGVTDQGLSIETSKLIDKSKPAIASSQYYAIKASRISPMLDVLNDLSLNNQNSISNLAFTKKVKALEKFVFIVATYISPLSEKKISKTNESSKSSNTTNSKTTRGAQDNDLQIGTKVYFRSKGMNREGTIIQILTDKDERFLYKIKYWKKIGGETTISLPLSRLFVDKYSH